MPPLKPSLVGPTVGEFRLPADEPASGARWGSISAVAFGSVVQPVKTANPANRTTRQSVFFILQDRLPTRRWPRVFRVARGAGPGEGDNNMELSAAIFGRRTIKDFKSDPVPAGMLDRVLTAGLWAQNHKLTEPWRFTVLGPETHRRLAAVFAESQVPAARADAEGKILSKPLVVAVSQRLGGDEAQQREDYAAVACAVQNIQLAAWAEGLGMQWSSGKIIRLPSVSALLGIERPAEEIVGLLFFGFPARTPAAPPRKPLSDVTRRLP